jgi:hypothetical protein
MAWCAFGIMPVPHASTTWEQTWSALREMVGECNQAIEQLVGRICRGLMVRGRGVDNTTLVGDLTDEMLHLLRLQQGCDLIDRHTTTHG